ncbi:hypothetical protein [uncultured Dubosiella sp.]|uniref:hypothetical protein n=1 Tax=uncultured Dubosiella sp. TaxID=1937011 RepID=UPI00263A3EE4|nr:hypothetical protein [uncultured Dubosiella sp.]
MKNCDSLDSFITVFLYTNYLLQIPNDRKVFAIWQIVKRIVRKRASLLSSALASNKKARHGKMVSPQRIMVFAAVR